MTLMGYIKVMRPPLTILGLLASLALVLWSGKPLLYEGLLIILAISLGNAGYTTMNEVVDVDVDAKNKPWKPLPSGQADFEKVLVISSVLIATSFCTIIILTICYGLFYLIGLLGLAFSHVYNVLRKDLLGNICMSGVYGIAALMSLYPKYPLFSVAFAMLTFAFNLAVQYQDLEAERTAGVVTAPQQLGRIGTCLSRVVQELYSACWRLKLAIRLLLRSPFLRYFPCSRRLAFHLFLQSLRCRKFSIDT